MRRMQTRLLWINIYLQRPARSNNLSVIEPIVRLVTINQLGFSIRASFLSDSTHNVHHNQDVDSQDQPVSLSVRMDHHLVRFPLPLHHRGHPFLSSHRPRKAVSNNPGARSETFEPCSDTFVGPCGCVHDEQGQEEAVEAGGVGCG